MTHAIPSMTRRSLLLPAFAGTLAGSVLVGAALVAAPGAHAQSNGPVTGGVGIGTSPATRDVSKRGLSAASFLMMPVGARASAMGGAVVASSNDAASVYWNPSGLAQVKGGAFQAEYAQWFNAIDFNHATVAYPMGGGTVAVAVTALRTPEMEETTLEQQDGTGRTFDAASYAFGLSYARQLTDRFAIGGTAKFVSERISVSNATGFAVDLGTTFVTPLRGIRLGASISNFGTKMQMRGDDLRIAVDVDPNNSGNGTQNPAQLETGSFNLPLTMRVGLAGEAFRNDQARLTVAVDALSPSSAQQYVNVGAELGLLNDLVMVRGGYNELFTPDSAHGFTAGGGLRYGFGTLRLSLDYAFEASKYFDGVNRVTLAVGF